MRAADLYRYWNTVRHLKPVQVYGRARFRLYRLRGENRIERRPPPALREVGGPWVPTAERRQSQFGPSSFRFLNREGDLSGGWDDPRFEALWRYNLHYFDDLNAVGAADRSDWHDALIGRWISENPIGVGTGWDPYPTSLRIVNWIKRARSQHKLPEPAIRSLADQARLLARRIDWHLLGNHLFANAKALIFAGLFFEGEEADGWLETGLAILSAQIAEQILPDGGHFELSPMYHALVLEDVLDLVNVARVYGDALPARGRALAKDLEMRVRPMRRWLAAMCHPDCEIAFFNDSAVGIAPSPAELEAYAARLGFSADKGGLAGLTSLPDSGYVRLAAGPAVAILDVARVGPNYLPGHAHADTLSFELSVAGRRVVVNSGTSLYGTGPERLRQRGTAAHNTVTVAGQDSSEVWSGFRVARRARPFGLTTTRSADVFEVTCSHNGYRRLVGRPVHRRTWRLSAKGLTVLDSVDGDHPSEARFHFHPEAVAALEPAGEGQALTPDGGTVRFTAGPGARLEPATWHPDFGSSIPSRCLVVPLRDGQSRVAFRW